MQGAAIVLRTLVPNARRIFSIIAEQQMQDQEQGKTNWHLFQMCCANVATEAGFMSLRNELSKAVQDLS